VEFVPNTCRKLVVLDPLPGTALTF
jgi:hypothetical protein